MQITALAAFVLAGAFAIYKHKKVSSIPNLGNQIIKDVSKECEDLKKLIEQNFNTEAQVKNASDLMKKIFENGSDKQFEDFCEKYISCLYECSFATKLNKETTDLISKLLSKLADSQYRLEFRNSKFLPDFDFQQALRILKLNNCDYSQHLDAYNKLFLQKPDSEKYINAVKFLANNFIDDLSPKQIDEICKNLSKYPDIENMFINTKKIKYTFLSKNYTVKTVDDAIKILDDNNIRDDLKCFLYNQFIEGQKTINKEDAGVLIEKLMKIKDDALPQNLNIFSYESALPKISIIVNTLKKANVENIEQINLKNPFDFIREMNVATEKLLPVFKKATLLKYQILEPLKNIEAEFLMRNIEKYGNSEEFSEILFKNLNYNMNDYSFISEFNKTHTRNLIKDYMHIIENSGSKEKFRKLYDDLSEFRKKYFSNNSSKASSNTADASMFDEIKTLTDLLGIKEPASLTREKIAQLKRNLAFKYHPDVFAHANESDKAKAEALKNKLLEFLKIKDARNTDVMTLINVAIDDLAKTLK